MCLTAACDWEVLTGGLVLVWFLLMMLLVGGRVGLCLRPLAMWIPSHSGLDFVIFLILGRIVAWVRAWVVSLGSSVCCFVLCQATSWSLLGSIRLVHPLLQDRVSVAQMQQHSREGGWTWTSTTCAADAGQRLYRSRCTGVRRWFLLFWLFGLLRIGEALHPGPNESQQETWTLGVANPSGLNGKLDQVHHLEGDAWIFTETQLSAKGVSDFVKGLKMLRSPWKYAIAGAPCLRRASSDVGSHSGVMFVSKFPSRALTHGFDASTFDSARLQVVGMAVADLWITVGLLYGLPCNAHHKQARFQTDSLLAELVDRIGCQTAGPRAIGGDFNFGPDELSQLDRLRSLGFREVQDFSAWRFGVSAEATGRGSRRIDQLWISPELQHAYLSTNVAFDHWADHAAVNATFSVQGLQQVHMAWHVPQPLPWPSDWSCQVQVDFALGATAAYASFWGQVETQAKCRVQHEGSFVSKKQCGRAGVLSPVPTKEFLCPMKKGRRGDLQPTYLGVSLQHARYFRQLRRLQALCRLLAKGVNSWNGQLNRDETWKAIRHAAGFAGGFGLWCGVHGLCPLVGPLPLLCPALEYVQALFDGFHKFVRQYETELIRARYQFAKSRREHNLAYVFQDCKDDSLPQADTLVDSLVVGVEEVREEDASLVLVRPTQLLDGLPVVVGGRVVEVVAHSEDQVWVDSVGGLESGMFLTQERAVHTDEAILARFAQVWGPRWLKMSHVQDGQWDQICGFLSRTVRPLDWLWHPWTVDRFRSAVAHKKPRAAKGPDGVSRADLAALPLEACEVFLDFYRSVEAGQEWPTQMASGFVSSLAKTPTAQKVDEFRPVVVYSLAYRIWSTERAREALQSIAQVLPDSVRGGVPARQAKSIWYELASVLEMAYLNDAPVHGLLMDIQKCFNNIPRQPLWQALILMGFPVATLRPWVSFVSSQSRRFRVRRSVGEPLISTCGLPEGCALSVFGMTVVDWMLDLWLQALDVSVDLRTFVDDWGLLFRDAQAFPRIWTSLETFTGQLDLALDMAKTRLWSTDASARKEFKQTDVKVALAARNLGAHQNFSRHCHNAELQKRLGTLPRVWVRLRASHGPYRHKLSAVQLLAWPRALHGVTVVHVGEAHFKTLRSGAVRALRADRKGANPYLHLATSAVQSDPEGWAILQTLRDTRELGREDQVESLLGLFATSSDRLPANGPTAVLAVRLQRLGWGIGSHGLVQDRFGSFSLMHVAWDELLLRFRLAWGFILSGQVAHRPTFDGLEHVDLPELHRTLKQFSPADQVFLRCHLDGTLFIQNARAKFQTGVTDQCPWCSSPDGFHHRAWICPHFASCRSHLTAAQLEVLPTLPPCLRDHGWADLVAGVGSLCWVFAAG